MKLRWFHWYITDDNGVKREHAKLQYCKKGYPDQVVIWEDIPHVWEDML